MKKKVNGFKKLVLLCVFALMVAIPLIPQTAAADGPPMIYWAVDSDQNLVISDQPVTGAYSGEFAGSDTFTSTPGWDLSIKTVRIEGAPRPMRTDHWFNYCSSLTSADLTGLDLSTCWSTVNMFQGCSNLKTVDMSVLGISSSCKDMSYTFYGCSKLESVNLTNMDLKNCEDMKGMFSGCEKLKELDLSALNIASASESRYLGMSNMLVNCKSLNKIVLGSSYKKATLALPYENHTDGYWIRQGTNEYYYGAEVLPAGSGTYIYTTDIPQEYKAYWALRANGENYDLVISPNQVTGDYSGQYFTLVNPFAWEQAGVSKDKIISAEFQIGTGGKKVKYHDLSVKKNSSTVGIFQGCTNLQSVVLDGLDASACKSTDHMFYNCSSLTSIDLRKTGLASVESAVGMFSGCSALTEVLFDPEHKAQFGDVSNMFYNCTSLEEFDLRSIDASTWNKASYTFSGCSKLKKLDGSDINAHKLVELRYMLDGCTSLELLVAGSRWDGDGWATYYYNGPNLPLDMYELTRKDTDGSYHKFSRGTELLGYDRESSVLFSVYVSESLLNNAAELAKLESLVDVTLKAKALSGITDPEEKKAAGIAAQAEYDALPDEVKDYLPAWYLNQIQNAVNPVNPDPGPNPDDQMGTDGTPVGPGASAATAEKAITSMTADADPAGSVFSRLAFKSKKQGKNSINLSWNKAGNAKTYVIYGNKCGKGIKPVKIATSTGNALAVKAISGKKLAKGTYYKFIIVALDSNNKVVSTSKLIHVATAGGKVGNHKKVTVKKAVTKKAKKLKKGKTLKLKAKAVKKSKKVKKHVGVRYESSNAKIATVSAKGIVKGNSKGTCYVYAYAQNGVSKKIKVTVK